MNFVYKKEEVSISFNENNGELLIMDSKGNQIKEIYYRCRIESIAAVVMRITGFEEMGFDKAGRKKYKWIELYFFDKNK